ncbi:MAG: hypothetical protein M3301_10025 [Chloroflexota bacterium]|nr:hypothetical protein [Chloroflexota bacterium]
MDSLHLALALLAVALSLLLAGVTGLDVARQRWHPFLADRLILALLGALVLACAVGATIALRGRPPADLLHLLYSGLALAVVPVARYLARSGTPRRRAAIVGTGTLLLLGFLVRLFMTGAPS